MTLLRHKQPRSERIASAVTRLTRLYLQRRRQGRPLAGLLARSKRLSAAYLKAREADYSRPL